MYTPFRQSDIGGVTSPVPSQFQPVTVDSRVASEGKKLTTVMLADTWVATEFTLNYRYLSPLSICPPFSLSLSLCETGEQSVVWRIRRNNEVGKDDKIQSYPRTKAGWGVACISSATRAAEKSKFMKCFCGSCQRWKQYFSGGF